MGTHVYARHELTPVAHDALRDECFVLLEGSWPAELAASRFRALDDELDARHRDLDEAAERLAHAAAGLDPAAPHDLAPVSLAWLNLLPLRYWLVKLLRVVRWFEEHAAEVTEPVVWHLQTGRDDDYRQLAVALMGRMALRHEIAWHDSSQPVRRAIFPANDLWRRALGWVCGDRRLRADSAAPRVVLCGNPRLLDPICAELIARGARVWWLYDRFAVGSWWRWRPRGARQLVCDSSVGRANRLPRWPAGSGAGLDFAGLDLAPLVRSWLAARASSHGARQSRLVEQVAQHFRRVRPTHLVVDEDATPLPRGAIAAAAEVEAPTAVVQNAAPGVRFGFTSFTADKLYCWGDSSRAQLLSWGLPAERLTITGSPWHDELCARIAKQSRAERGATSGPRLLLLATPGARDERPDLLAYHKTTRTYGAMAGWCLAAAAQYPGASLTIKLHPRAASTAPWAGLARRWPQLVTRLVIDVPLEELFARCDAVISLGSSAGIEAALARLPVVQVMPAGSDDLLPAASWGLIGTARGQDELDQLLARALTGAVPSTPRREVFGSAKRPAAARLVDAMLAPRVRARRQEQFARGH